MTDISLNLIGKIDEDAVALIAEIDNIARNLNLPFFIVGATAQDKSVSCVKQRLGRFVNPSGSP